MRDGQWCDQVDQHLLVNTETGLDLTAGLQQGLDLRRTEPAIRGGRVDVRAVA